MAQKTVRLKLLIDTEGNRVLFGESGKEFVDFVFNILSLPVGTVIRLLTKQMVGSLGNLYDSIENLSDTYILPNQSKYSILNPKVVSSAAYVPLLLPNIKPSASSSTTTSTSTMFYSCIYALDYGRSSHKYVTNEPNTKCPQCGRLMTLNLTFIEPLMKNQGTSDSSSEGGYVKGGVVTYMIMDDLVVRPMSTISSITMLNQFNVKDVGALEEKVVKLTMDEGIKLLKAAMQSKNVLSDVFLKKKNFVRKKASQEQAETRRPASNATEVSNQQRPRTRASSVRDERGR